MAGSNELDELKAKKRKVQRRILIKNLDFLSDCMTDVHHGTINYRIKYVAHSED